MSRRKKHDKPLVGINLLYIRPGHLGGTIRYALELIKYLSLQNQFRLKIYVQKNVLLDPMLRALPKKEFKVIGGLLGRVMLEHAWLPIIAKMDGVDLLFSPGFVTPLWGRFLKVVTIHDLYYKLFPEFVRPWQRRYWQLFIPMSIYKTNAVITVSDATRHDLNQTFPNADSKTTRIYLGADGGHYNHDVADWRDDPFCLVVGNMTPNKNIESVVAAFLLLKQQNVAIRLIVAGNDIFGRLSNALAAINEPLDIELLEHVDDEVLALLYNKACCLIQASYYEGFGLPVVEAMARGCPVVVSDVPVLREICKDAALYFPAHDPAVLAKQIQVFLKDSTIRQQHVERGEAAAEPFKWEQTAKETGLLFGKLLNIKSQSAVYS